VPKLCVLIPSRTQPRQQEFLERSIGAVRGQRGVSALEIEVRIGLDRGAPRPALSGPAVFAEAASASQAAAINAAAAAMDCDFVACLEDDDVWAPDFIGLALEAARQAPFVSSTQIEVDDRDFVLQVQDFPTPSGWFMTRAAWDKVGPFNEDYQYHLDNEWLGRLAESGLARMHLVESTAPVIPEIVRATRPLLARVLAYGGPNLKLARHHLPVPLVRRLVHRGSGMAMIAAEPARKARSLEETNRLKERFGRVPA
jgi:hypothetical protein